MASIAPSARGLRHHWVVRLVGRLLVIASVVCTSLAYFGAVWWGFDLLSHFRLQMFLGLIPIVMLSIWIGRRAPLLLATLCLIANGITLWPYFGPQLLSAAPAAAAEGDFLTVMVSNILTHNPDRQTLARIIEREDPDIVALLEFSLDWEKDLSGKMAAWPYRASLPAYDNFGLGIYSKLPLGDTTWPSLAKDGPPSLFTSVQWDAATIPIVVTHPPPPVNRWTSLLRNEHLRTLAIRSEARDPFALVLGDLNASPWSYGMRLLQPASLHDARIGFGLVPTWHAHLPFPGRVPIDYILVGSQWSVHEFRAMEPIGSDHLGLIAVLKKGASTP